MLISGTWLLYKIFWFVFFFFPVFDKQCLISSFAIICGVWPGLVFGHAQLLVFVIFVFSVSCCWPVQRAGGACSVPHLPVISLTEATVVCILSTLWAKEPREAFLVTRGHWQKAHPELVLKYPAPVCPWLQGVWLYQCHVAEAAALAELEGPCRWWQVLWRGPCPCWHMPGERCRTHDSDAAHQRWLQVCGYFHKQRLCLVHILQDKTGKSGKVWQM